MNEVQLLYEMVNRFCDYQEARAAQKYDVVRQSLLVTARTSLDHAVEGMLRGEPRPEARKHIQEAADRYRGTIAKFLPRFEAPVSVHTIRMRKYRKEKQSCHKPQPKSKSKPARRSRSAPKSSASSAPQGRGDAAAGQE